MSRARGDAPTFTWRRIPSSYCRLEKSEGSMAARGKREESVGREGHACKQAKARKARPEK